MGQLATKDVAKETSDGGHTPAVAPERAPTMTEKRGNAARQEDLALDEQEHHHDETAPIASGPTEANSAEMAADEVMVPRGGGDWTVKRGDNLWNIAKATYGSGTYWTRIRDANRSQVGGRDIIQVGAVLTLPELQVPATGSPSVKAGAWTVEGVLAHMKDGQGPQAIDKILNDKIRIVRFDAGYDVWEYDDGRREQEEIVGLRGNTSAEERTIRIHTSLSDVDATLTLFHELNHWGRPESHTKEEYLDEEVDVRVKTEEFAIASGLPPKKPEYRNADGTVNVQFIHDEIYGSSHYNPKGRKRVGREYAGEIAVGGWHKP